MYPPHPTELWVRCRNCTRWFTVNRDRSHAAEWQCPVCGGEPDRLENRAHPEHAHARHRVGHRPGQARAAPTRSTARHLTPRSAGAPLPEVWHG